MFKYSILSFQRKIYFMLKRKGEMLICDVCKAKIKPVYKRLYGQSWWESVKVFVILPASRDDMSIDRILCESCGNKTTHACAEDLRG